jgi:rSAM/selenodomain-associated transferase 1
MLIVFAKAPVPGRVKTRLIPLLGAEGAARFHESMVGSLLRSLRQVAVELHTDCLTSAWPFFHGVRRLQAEGDLGVRMLHALKTALAQGHTRVTLLGSDCPEVGWRALRRVVNSPADVSLGAASDGGFWAISARQVHSGMFEGVAWSTSSTLLQTLRSCRRCGLSASAGPLLSDVDEPRDFARLYAYLPASGRGQTLRLLHRPGKRFKVIHF